MSVMIGQNSDWRRQHMKKISNIFHLHPDDSKYYENLK